MGSISLLKYALESRGNLTYSLTCGTIVQTHVQRKGRTNLLTQDSLREERTPWLINFLRQGNFSDVGHFNTPPQMWQLLAKYVFNR
jgi:hypothetical protein